MPPTAFWLDRPAPWPRLRPGSPSATSRFSYVCGITSTKSLPLIGVVMNEVRRMQMSKIQLVEQRYAYSPYPMDIKVSPSR